MSGFEFKCPSCGGPMEFNPDLQELTCPFCDHVQSMDSYETSDRSDINLEEQKDPEIITGCDGTWSEEDLDGVVVYRCKSCGGEIVTQETTGSTSCPYCGNKVFVQSAFSGDARPDFVLPFAHTKKQAKEAYLKHLENKSFLPSIFKSRNHIDEIMGVYVPYWLFDGNIQSYMRYQGQNIRTWQQGDTEYKETTTYDLLRQGRMRFEKIPVDGSQKMDDALMESIEPFDVGQAKPFNPGFLAGYVADRYDVDEHKSLQRAKMRMQVSAAQVIEDTIEGYDKVDLLSDEHSLENIQYVYGLYPVWILNTTWKDKQFVFAMNGQTGKMVGDLPCDKAAYYKFMALVALLTAVLSYAAQWLYLRF